MTLIIHGHALRIATRQRLSCTMTLGNNHGSMTTPPHTQRVKEHIRPLQRFIRHFKAKDGRKDHHLRPEASQGLQAVTDGLAQVQLGGRPLATPAKPGSVGLHESAEHNAARTGSHGFAPHTRLMHSTAALSPSQSLEEAGHGSRLPVFMSYGGSGDALPAMPTPVPMAQANGARLQDRRYPSVPSWQVGQSTLRPHSFAFDARSHLPHASQLSAPQTERSVTAELPSWRSEQHGLNDKVKQSKPKRSAALESDPSKSPGLRQCWGIKRDGTRCMRKVGQAETLSSPQRAAPNTSTTVAGRKENTSAIAAIVVDDSDSDTSRISDSDSVGEYCHQHAREINKTQGFVLPTRRDSRRRRTLSASSVPSGRADGHFVDFSPYLCSVAGLAGEENCKARLRAAMSRAPTEVDWTQRGYLYVYELRDRSTATHIALKVGRAVNVYKRFEQWRAQCQSKNPLLRAYFPRPPGTAQAVLPGASPVMQPGALLSHKWENLCHIELSTLGKRLDDRCSDCGSRHREIFLVPRDAGGYERVRMLIEKWLQFVELLARNGYDLNEARHPEA